MSQLKIKNVNDNSWIPIPAGGVGVPSGGSAGEFLKKSSGTDYATEWALPLTMKLLWTNPSPTSAFAAQTVGLSLSGYDQVLIKVRFGSSSGDYENAYMKHLCDIGETTTLSVFNAPNTASANMNVIMAARNANISTSGIVFGGGLTKVANTTGNPSTDNTACIPFAIYGIKGVLTS